MPRRTGMNGWVTTDPSYPARAAASAKAGEAAKAGERKAAIEPRRAGNPAAVVALTYVGTVVGAGFASGQEVLQFFTAQGRPGLLAMVMAAGLFGWVGASIMLYGRRFGAESHLPVVQHVAGKRTRAATILDGIITFFLLGTAAAMVSGAGSIASEQFGISRWLGGGLLAAAAVLTVLAGVHRVIESISIVAPFLLLSVLGLAAAAVILNPDPPAAVSRMFTVSPLTAPATPGRAGWPVNSGGSPALRELSAISSLLPYLGSWGWLVAGLLYLAYNLVLSVSVLAPLGKEARSRGAVVAGGYLGGAALMLGVFAIQSAMLALLPADELRALDIPMLGVARRLSPVLGIAYSVVLMAEVYTTAVANLYGFAARLAERKSSPGRPVSSRGETAPTRPFRLIVVMSGVAAGIAAGFGFAQVVGTLYPLMGLAGLVLVALVIRARVLEAL